MSFNDFSKAKPSAKDDQDGKKAKPEKPMAQQPASPAPKPAS